MNVEIGTEAAQFPEKEYQVEFSLQCALSLHAQTVKFVCCLVTEKKYDMLSLPFYKHSQILNIVGKAL